MNEWVTVRKREKAIYTKGTVDCSDLCRKSRHRSWNFQHSLKTRYKTQPESAQNVYIRTPYARRDFRCVSTADTCRNRWREHEGRAGRGLGVGTFNICQDFRHVSVRDPTLEVLTDVGTSNDHCPRATRWDFRHQ